MRSYLIPMLILPFFISCGGEESNDENINDEMVQDETIHDENEIEVVEGHDIANTFDIRTQEVGIFKVGHLVPELPSELKSRKSSITINEEGVSTTYDVMTIFNDLEDVVDLRLEDNDAIDYLDKHIMDMTVYSNYYETEEGISVGSTLEEFIGTYPDYEIWTSYISGLIVIEAPEYAQVQFVLDPNGYKKTIKGDSDYEVLDKNDFDETTKITSIRVF